MMPEAIQKTNERDEKVKVIQVDEHSFHVESADACHRVLFTPDGKRMILLEYDDSAYEKDGPNDPPPLAYIIDVEDNSYKTVEIPWTPYGNFITPDSKYLIVGSYLKGSILKIDLDEARVVKQITSTKTIFDFHMAPSGNYFMVIYDYEKTPRKVVDFRNTEDLGLLTVTHLVSRDILELVIDQQGANPGSEYCRQFLIIHSLDTIVYGPGSGHCRLQASCSSKDSNQHPSAH